MLFTVFNKGTPHIVCSTRSQARSNNIDETSDSIWLIIKFSCEILSLAFLQTLLWDYYMKSEQESCSRGEEITQSVLFLPCLVLPRSIRSSQSVTEYTHTHTHTHAHTHTWPWRAASPSSGSRLQQHVRWSRAEFPAAASARSASNIYPCVSVSLPQHALYEGFPSFHLHTTPPINF